MKKIAFVLASLVLGLPLVSVAALSGSGSTERPDALEAPAQSESSSSYRCCWVYHLGIWYCIPC